MFDITFTTPANEQVHPGLRPEKGYRRQAASIVRWLFFGALFATIALSPLRAWRTLVALPSPPVFREYTDIFLYPSDLALLATCLLGLANRLLAHQPLSLRPRLMTFALAGLTLFSTLSTFSSIAPLLSLYHSLRLILLFILYLVLVNENPSLGVLATGSSLLVITQAGIGIAQVIAQRSLGLSWLNELALNPEMPGMSIIWTAAGRFLRAYGLTDHPNILGGCLAFSLIILLGAYLQVRPIGKPLVAAIFGLGAIGLFVSFSRSAWLGLACGMGLLAAWQVTVRRSRGFLPLIGLWSGTLVLLLPFMLAQAPLLSSRLNLNAAMTTSTPETQSLGERSLLIRKGVEIFWRHPLSGVGVGAFPLALMESIPGFPFDYQPPHWVLVDVAAETGLPGAASYAFLSLAPWALLAGHAFRIGIHRLFRSSPWKKLEIASLFFPLAVASALLLALNLVSLLDYYPWMLNPGRTWHWMAWGAWSGAYMKAFGGQNG